LFDYFDDEEVKLRSGFVWRRVL